MPKASLWENLIIKRDSSVASLPQNDKSLLFGHPGFGVRTPCDGNYQIFTRSPSARHIGSPSLMPNVVKNSGMSDKGPITRNFAGECSLLFTWLATASGRSLTIHASA